MDCKLKESIFDKDEILFVTGRIILMTLSTYYKFITIVLLNIFRTPTKRIKKAVLNRTLYRF